MFSTRTKSIKNTLKNKIAHMDDAHKGTDILKTKRWLKTAGLEAKRDRERGVNYSITRPEPTN